MVSEPANPWRKSRAMGIKNPKFLPVLAADRPYSFSSYGGAPVDWPYSFSGYGGGPNRSVVKVPDIVPGKIPNPAPISGKITKSMVRYEAVASDPTAVWRIASATNYKTDMVQHKRGDFQKVMAGMHESLNRIEELVQKLVSSQTRELPDLVPPAEWENEKTRRSEDLKLISLNSTQGTQLRNTPEGNFNSPPNGYSVVVTGWGDDPLPHAVIASPTLNNMNPSHGPEMAKDMERGVSVVADKHACIEEDDLNTLNKQVRHFTGFGNTPMVYPLKPVIEEIQKSAEETKANILDEAQFDLTQLYMVGRAVKRLRCTGLFWKLPPWPDFGAMVCNQIAQHRGYGVLMNFHSVKQYNHSVLDYIGTKMVANWIMGNLTVYLINEKLSIDAIKFTPWKSCELVASMRNGTIRGKIGKEILNELIAKGGSVKPMMEEGGLVQIADPAAIEAIDKKNNICNISVIAHVDHGKSTLTDSLVAAAGTIVQEVAGDISKTDTRVDETKRGITIKFIGISPFYEMTEVSLKSYKIERDGNKMGRCFMELQVEGEEAYQTSSSVIENANVIMASYDDQLPGDAQVYPEKGTVAFFAGLHGWVFTLSNSTKMYAYKFGVDESKVMERLWGENYFDPTTKKRTIQHTGSATCKRGFVQFRDEPIEQILSICMNDQKDKLWPMWRKLGVTMKAEENELRGKTLIKSVMQTWLPVSNILFEMMIFHLTISSKAQNYRVENLYEGSLDDNYATVISHFDLEGSLLLNVSKMIPTSQKGRFLAFSHVFSRKVAIDKYLYVKSVQHPEIWKGKKQEYVEDVPCGDIVAMGGLDQFITKDATLTNEKEVNTCPIRVMKLSVFPVVGVAVQCELVEIYNADIPADSYKTHTSLNIVTAYDFVLVRGTKTLNLAKSVALPSGKYLFDGVVDGHNFWADGLAASLGILQSLESIVGKDKLVMATSRSFMHLVVDLVNEAKLDTESKSWLPFTAQKVAAALKCCDHRRATDSSAKLDAQQKPNIQVLPTTTTGSFPQTVDLRRVRREYKANKIFEEYINAIKEGINKEYISAIKERDIDVFIYGEPERNDRVEYFGEQLRFCVHCQRMGAKTAQSLTFRPMKEMFTSLGFLIKALEGKYAAKGEGMSEPAID